MIKADQAIETGIPPRFQKVMTECRDMALSHFVPLVKEMEENIDVALLEFAEKAESNTAQARFFEAMQEIKRKQAALERCLVDNIKKGFDEFPGEGSVVTDGDDLSLDDLSLLDKDEVELTLPLTNMVAKANSAYMQQLYGLDKRLAIVNGGEKVPDEGLPAAPSSMSAGIRAAVDTLEVDNKIRVILFAMYDKFVMTRLSDLYEEFNKRLIQAKILPNLKYEIRKRADGTFEPVPARQGDGSGEEMEQAGSQAGHGAPVSAARAPTGRGASRPQSLGDEVFGSILELMSSRRQAAVGGTAIPEPTPAVAAVGRQQLVTTLSAIQSQNIGPTVGIAAPGSGHPLIEEVAQDQSLLSQVRETLADERRKVYDGVDRRKILSADMDIIELVGMLFDYILEDEKLTASMKALLSRLHTPYLKLAVLDKQLFSEDTHPARKLLNAMARTGAQWASDDQLDRGVFPVMRAIVERVLNDFDKDISLFDQLREELKEKLKELQHKAQVVEQRAVEAAKGQAKLQGARKRAGEEIRARLTGGEWPARIVDMLQRTWSEKLMFILLRDSEGEEGESWALGTAFVDKVLSTVDRENIRANRADVESALPETNSSLRETIETLSCYGHHDIERLMTTIEDCQQATLAGCEKHRGTKEEAAVPTGSGDQEDNPPVPDMIEAVDAKDSRIPEEVWEPVAELVEESPDDQELSQAERDMIEQLHQTRFGTWFEFTEGGQARRLRLAWFSVVTSNCMFVDGTGVKAREKSFPELARALIQGSARIVEGEKKPLFDRALDTIIGFLKKNSPAVAAG